MSRAPSWTKGQFLHPCSAPGCDAEGSFGEGVSLRRERLGRWWCRAHLPARFWDQEPAAVRVPETVAAKKTVKKSDQGRLL